MKKVLLSMAVASALLASDSATEELRSEIEALKKELAGIKKTIKKARLSSMKKQLKELKIETKNDNIKFNVDFRSSVDSIRYKRANGEVEKNNAFLTNKLLLDMKYKPLDNLVFLGQLGYYKAFGDSADHSQGNNPMNSGYADFDWITNESALDNTLKLKQAYFVYFGKDFLSSPVNWTASVGRRPSTLGFPSYLRADNARPQSPVGHAIDVEFDGASFKFDLDRVTGVSGMYFKLCMGRGLTNAKPRFDFSGAEYVEDKAKNPDIDMVGFIFQPIDDGQYKAMIQVSKAMNLIGYTDKQLDNFDMVNAGINPMTNTQFDPIMMPNYQMAYAPSFKDVGNMYLGSAAFMVNGIGDMINDFLDDTKLFASVAYSKTEPNRGKVMLGSSEKESGHSIYLGAQIPTMLADGKIGFEYNKGSKYWRSMTYGEDTAIGSKLSTRGDAYEIYYNQPILDKILSMQIRYTYLDYKYTGSNSFFGAEGKPMSMKEAQESGANPVESAQDLRLYFRYKY